MKFNDHIALLANLAQNRGIMPTALANNFFSEVTEEPVEASATPEDIQPYGRAHGEKLSPEQLNYLQPILELCEQSLMEGESILVMGSHGVAPSLLPYLTDTQRLADYNAELRLRDYDLQILSERVYNSFLSRFSPDQITTSYVFGVGLKAEVPIDILDNQKFAQEFVKAGRSLLPQFDDVDRTATENTLIEIEKGDTSRLPELNRLYAPDTLGVRLTKVGNELVPTIYDPINFLQSVNVNPDGYPTFEKAINEHSLRFLFLEKLAYSQLSANPYATDLTELPSILVESDDYEIVATSALIELPRLVKGGLTHEISFSDRNIMTVYYAARELARLNPHFAVQHNSIARYVKSVQQTLVQNLDSFAECLALMTEKFPMGWCISPADLSTEAHIRKSSTNMNYVGIDTNPLLDNLQDIVSKNGQPNTIEEALGMYLAADSGGAFDPVQFERNVDQIFAWWVPNFPDLDREIIAQSYKRNNLSPKEEITTIQA